MATYFNKADRDDDQGEEDNEKTPWDEMGTNDWGETQESNEDKWEDFSSNSSPPPSTTAPKNTVTSSSASAWVQDKPNQSKNDWDSDAFFNDVLTTSNKPKLKTTRR